jgi:hypothetical protein
MPDTVQIKIIFLPLLSKNINIKVKGETILIAVLYKFGILVCRIERISHAEDIR